jgi:hypothetical protein
MLFGLSEYIFARLSRRSAATLLLLRMITGCPAALIYMTGPKMIDDYQFQCISSAYVEKPLTVCQLPLSK